MAFHRKLSEGSEQAPKPKFGGRLRGGEGGTIMGHGIKEEEEEEE